MAKANGNAAVAERPEDLVDTPGETAEIVPGVLPSGFVRLSDVRKKAASAPSYATLAQFIGKMIQIGEIKVTETGKNKRGKPVYSGTMEFSPFDPANPDADAPEQTSPIPGAAIGMIVEALKAHPDETVVCEVVQTKRGLALR